MLGRTPENLFNHLQQQYYQAWFRYHPEQSVSAGLTEYAGLLRSYDNDDVGALMTLNQKLISALYEINTDDLKPDKQIDYQILLGAAEIELRELEEQDWRYRDPVRYLPVNAVHQLLIHDVDNVHQALKHRLEKVPEYLRGARALLSQSPEVVVTVWLNTAINLCECGVDFIRNLGRHPLVTQKFSTPARLQPLFDNAANALEDFRGFLEREVLPHASGHYACGQACFDRLLNKQHFFQTCSDDVLRFGEQLFEQTRKELIAQTQHMQGDENVAGLLDKIRRDRPHGQQLLDVYRVRIKKAYNWLSSSGLMTMPEQQSLNVLETPPFMRALIPLAAYEQPLPGEREPRGIYYVTPDGGAPGPSEHNNTSIDLTCAHEAFPGHHLQFVIAGSQHSLNPVRLINDSASMYEGWALYCEDLVVEQGMLGRDEHRFMQLRDRLWRALRIIIDVRLHTGELGYRQAVEQLITELGFNREQAEAEINWYSAAPTRPLCYALGRELIVQAREHYMQTPGATLQEFHDKLLAQGSIALPLVIRQAFGEDTWQAVYGNTLGSLS